MKSIDVIGWSTDPVRHLHRHGSWFTFCNLDVSANALDGVLVNRYPLYKAKRDAPTPRPVLTSGNVDALPSPTPIAWSFAAGSSVRPPERKS